MKQCPHCKTNNPDNANYCGHCRNALSGNTIENINKKIDNCNYTLNNINTYTRACYYDRTVSKRINLIIGTVAIILILTFAVVFIIRDMKREKQIAQLEKNMATYFKVPIIIESLKVGNVDDSGTIQTEYGEKLYSDSTMFLSPQIEYFGLYKSEIILNLKLYGEGELQHDAQTSPNDYSYDYTDSFEANEGVKVLNGWGSQTKGCYSAGNYRYEVWYNGICLKVIDFKIY